MNNLFPPHRDVHETYDLKGSAFGREYDEEKAKTNPKAVLKDINWVNRGRTLELGPEKRALLSEQLRRDMEFLKKMKVMDYSLLVGIHNMERGNRDNLRENQLSMFHVSCFDTHTAELTNSPKSEVENRQSKAPLTMSEKPSEGPTQRCSMPLISFHKPIHPIVAISSFIKTKVVSEHPMSRIKIWISFTMSVSSIFVRHTVWPKNWNTCGNQ
jgi:hypothetical protein